MNKLFIHPQQSKTNPLWLAFLRCSISALTLFEFLAIQGDFDALFAANGYVSPDISSAFRDRMLPSIYSLHQLLHADYHQLLLFFRILFPLSLVFLFLGLFTRLSAALSLILQLTIINSIDFYSYGVDTFITIALFYCFLFPVGTIYSLDDKLFKRKPPAIPGHKYLGLLRAHMCLIYFFSGFEKILGINWRNGESIWKVIHTYKHLDVFNLDFLSNTPAFFLMGWATVIIEMLYPIFMNLVKTRKLWLCAVLGLHISIALLMGLYFFSAVMIALNLACYYVPFVEEKNPIVKDTDPGAAETKPLLQYSAGTAIPSGTG